MTEVSRAASFLSAAIDCSGLTQRQIALQAGFSRPNFISMMKSGETKIPISRVPGLAKACGFTARELLEIVLSEDHPEIWEVIKDAGLLDPLTTKETVL